MMILSEPTGKLKETTPFLQRKKSPGFLACIIFSAKSDELLNYISIISTFQADARKSKLLDSYDLQRMKKKLYVHCLLN